MAPQNDIEDLVSRVAVLDQRAFATFYDRTAAFVFGLLLRMLSDRHTAEEVAQEVYMQVWRTAPAFDPGRSSALGWIATIARSRAIDRLRADTSRLNALQGLREQPASSSGPDPAEAASLGERRARVREAVESLSAEQRSAIELAFFQGLTHSEIARETNTPLGTVKTRIRAAVGKLEQALRGLSG